jgi:hypothetical protein
MVFRGHIKDGKVELDQLIPAPNGVEVQVTVGPINEAEESAEYPPLFDRLKDFVGCVDDLPADASINIDYYLYGHPKR